MRRPAARNRPRKAELKSFPAPTAGWIANRNLAVPNMPGAPQGAEVLENYFPTAQKVVLRRGTEKYATLGDGDTPVTALFSYVNGSQAELFGATASAIYDITTVTEPLNYLLSTESGDTLVTDTGDNFGQNSTDGLDVLTGLTGGDWVAVQFATSGGVFLVGVNGADPSFLYDGTRFYPIGTENVYTLAYDAGTVSFTAGETLTGGTSGATATIVAVDGDETSGTLIIHTVSGGPFTDNETITDGAGGSADADGTEALAYNGITGVATSDLNHVWVYKNRMFFVEKDSLDAWYLPVDAVSGAATKFPLGGVFTRGGSLLFGASWSLGEGAAGGLSSQCVFVTTEGEVAVYQGSDPNSNFTLVGVYRIGKPLGKTAYIRAGGDLVIATDIGFVPLSQALQKDYAALSPSAVSYPIEDAWRQAVELRRSEDWKCEIWPTQQMVVVALPTVNDQSPQWFVANARTGAWAPFTNWNATCVEVFQERMFFGSVDGQVFEANVTGQDNGVPYTGTYVPLFDDLNRPGSRKVAKMARPTIRAKAQVQTRVSCQTDFEIDLPPAPDAVAVDASQTWGGASWGEAVWGASTASIVQGEWKSIGSYGYSIAPAVQITSGSTVPIDAEIIKVDMTFETTDIVA